MCSHRLAIAKLVREYKEPLFSPVSSQVTRQHKQNLWEFIRQQAVAQGAVQYARKSWKEIRDCVWAPIRRDTMAKLNKAKTVGEDTVVFTEIDRVVLDIIGTNASGDDGGAELDESIANGSGMGDESAFSEKALNIEAIMAELANGDREMLLGDSEFKPQRTYSQQMGSSAGPRQQQGQFNLSAVLMNNIQQPNSDNGGEIVVDHNSIFRQAGLVWGAEQPKPSKRRAVEQHQRTPPLTEAEQAMATSVAEAELDRAIKQAQLERVQLQNQLLQEQIEEKRLQNHLLRVEVLSKQAKVDALEAKPDAEKAGDGTVPNQDEPPFGK